MTYRVLMRSRLYFAMVPADCESQVVYVATSREDMDQFLEDRNITSPMFNRNKWLGTTRDDGEKCWYHIEVHEQ